jgi:4-amino-4-deoxy-L-arabinose transferase-like glycosyltransferase
MIPKLKYEYLLGLISLFSIFLINSLLSLYSQNDLCLDCENYFESAIYLFKNFEVHYYRPIGMSIIYGLPILIGYDNYLDLYNYVIIINILFYTAIIIYFFKISCLFFDKKKSFYFSLVLLTYFGISLHLNEMLSEIPFIFFTLIAFYCLAKYYILGKTDYLFYAISLLLFTILIRPGILYFAFGIFIFYLFTIHKNWSIKRALILIIPAILILFQMIKMKEKYGNYTISYIDAVTYYNYLGSKSISLKDNKILNQNNNKRADFIFSQAFKNQKNIAYQDLIYQIKNNTCYLVKAYIDDVEENTKTATSRLQNLKNIENEKYFDVKIKLFSGITEWQNKLTTLFGLLLAIYFTITFNKHNKVVFVFALYFIYIFFISGISSTQGDRFHIVFYPIVLLLLLIFFKKINNITNKYIK